MNKRVIQSLGLCSLAIVALAACQNDRQVSNDPTSYKYNDLYFPAYGPHQQPAPAAKPAPAPAPAPAPMGMCTASMAYPTGDRATSAVWVEKSIPCEVTCGQSFDYWIKVTNLTKLTLENVTVSDTLSNIKVNSSDPTAANDKGGSDTWSLGSIEPGATKTIKLTGTPVDCTKGINTCATVAYSNMLCRDARVVNPGLKLTETLTPEGTPCDMLMGKITVCNPGTGVARNVKVKSMLADGLTVDGKSSAEYTVDMLAPGACRDITFTAKAAKTGTFAAKSTATADGNLTADAGASTTVKQAVLAINEACPGKIVLGRDYTYDITVTNNGDAPATNTVLESNIPGGTGFVSATDGGAASPAGASWNLGTLAPKASRKVSLTLHPQGIGSFKNTATVRAACAAPASTSCGTDAIGIPAMLLDGFDDPDPVQLGGTTTYTLKVTNQGFEKLTNVTLVCTLDDSKMMQYVSSTGGTASGNTVTFPALPELGPKQSRTFQVVVKAVGEGQVQLKAEAKSNEITRTLIKTETTNFYK